MAEQVRKDVAVFIDFENIYVSVRDKLDTNPNFEIIMDRCNELGRVILARAYADWYRYPRITSALYANNIEPMYVPTYYYDKDAGRTGRPIKNSVDMNLCIEAMRTLFTMPGLSTFVLITGDRDFIPLVNSIRQQGKDVIIIGVGGAASSHLAQSADEFIFYEHLIGKQIATAPAATSNRRYSEIDEFERPARDRATPVVQRASRAEATKPDKAEKTERKDKETTGLSEDAVWDLLAKAVVEARARSIVPSVGSLKTLVRELSNGEFRESMVRDANGRPCERFRDVVYEAAKRGKLIISTDSIVNEIFLPGEDPRTLSSFNVPMEKPPERAEEPLPSVAAANEVRATAGQANADKSRRRRRNDRDSKRQQPVTTAADVAPIEPVVPISDEYMIATPESVIAPLVVVPDTTVAADQPVQVAGVPFSDEERQMVRDIVASSERALSFQQIYDALRSTRNRGGEHQVPRTNEELRSLVKSIINAGELQRIGRGNRVSYRMAQPKTPNAMHQSVNDTSNDDAHVAEVTPDEVAMVPVVTSMTTVVENTAPVMVPTPDDLGDIDDGLSLPPLTPSTVKVTDSVATPPTKVTTKPKKQQTSRAKSKSSSATTRTSKPVEPVTPSEAVDTPDTPKAAASTTPAASSKATTTRKSSPSKQRDTKSKSTSARAKSTATATTAKPDTKQVPSPADATASAPKPRRRKQTPES
ncbi:MAG: NYN domain-containing protein [Roseiflexaceae bacterium]